MDIKEHVIGLSCWGRPICTAGNEPRVMEDREKPVGSPKEKKKKIARGERRKDPW